MGAHLGKRWTFAGGWKVMEAACLYLIHLLTVINGFVVSSVEGEVLHGDWYTEVILTILKATPSGPGFRYWWLILGL